VRSLGTIDYAAKGIAFAKRCAAHLARFRAYPVSGVSRGTPQKEGCSRKPLPATSHGGYSPLPEHRGAIVYRHWANFPAVQFNGNPAGMFRPDSPCAHM
jgi:hypothetical protein